MIYKNFNFSFIFPFDSFETSKFHYNVVSVRLFIITYIDAILHSCTFHSEFKYQVKIKYEKNLLFSYRMIPMRLIYVKY